MVWYGLRGVGADEEDGVGTGDAVFRMGEKYLNVEV